MDEALLYGARQTIETCLGVEAGERVIIISDEQTKEVSDALFRIADEQSPGNVKLYLMEDFGERTEEKPLVFPEELKTALENVDVSIYAASSRKGELQTFRMPMMRLVEQNKRVRHAHMPGITADLVRIGLGADYKQIQRRCAQLNEIVIAAETIKVTTPAGTNITAKFSPKHRWAISDGDLTKPGSWTNLPDGEVFTCPYSIDGKIVADGVLGDYFDKKYGLLDKQPLLLSVSEGRVTRIESDNHELAKEFGEYIAMDENANRFGEFAIGCNEGVKELVGNMLQDEKFPGIHVAVGDPYETITGANWSSKAHCDMVLQKCTIYVNGHKIMGDGKFLI